ncbi:uncharacterized protein LOC143913367 [Arctopsyche grandis]|uniref:uncharacterized protein LOC143913367 n=1 Tax=Arctopsyche grandis TaxID=121162 RepID=UPI00406D73C8
MKVSIVLLTVLVVAVFEANAAQFLEPNAKSPTQPNKCLSSGYNLHLKINKFYKMPSTCGRMYCDKTYTITYHTCASFSTDENVKIVEDLSLPYPDCCPRPVFEEESSTEE